MPKQSCSYAWGQFILAQLGWEDNGTCPEPRGGQIIGRAPRVGFLLQWNFIKDIGRPKPTPPAVLFSSTTHSHDKRPELAALDVVTKREFHCFQRSVSVKTDVIWAVQRLWSDPKVMQVGPPKDLKQLCFPKNNLAALDAELVCSCDVKRASSTGNL